ncbi:MAG: TetR family transcriptional regulator [Candidatus Dactylopiibacterium sp.]|nr:TetR family transcriptional regulator [Candidatus Dactylopiibacterium sp.]
MKPEALPDTRTRILDAAERLFTEHGFEGTSMRQITGEAGVNLAAANYHFGSKDALLEAVFKRRLAWLNSERLRVLSEMEAEAGQQPLKPSQIVDAFFGTLLRMGTRQELGGETFLRLLGRSRGNPNNLLHSLLAAEYDEVLTRFRDALYLALPEVPKVEIIWRLHFMLGATAYAIAGTDSLDAATDWQIPPGEQARQEELLLPRLMSFLLGGLRAPLADIRPEAPH